MASGHHDDNRWAADERNQPGRNMDDEPARGSGADDVRGIADDEDDEFEDEELEDDEVEEDEGTA